MFKRCDMCGDWEWNDFLVSSDVFFKQAGIVNGIVSAMGGLGGFFPPIILSFLFNLTGHYAIGYMALSEVALACLIIVVGMFYQERLNQANCFNESFESSSKKLKHG